MDHQEQHHQEHRKEREHEKHDRKLHEHQSEAKPSAMHPAWFLVIGIVLIAGIVAAWTFAF